MEQLIFYVAKYWQPLFILLIGFAALALVGFFHWYGNMKSTAVRWIARVIFRSGPGSDLMAEGLFMILTSFLIVIAFIWIGVATLYLQQ
jgi:hypothetical protein